LVDGLRKSNFHRRSIHIGRLFRCSLNFGAEIKVDSKGAAPILCAMSAATIRPYVLILSISALTTLCPHGRAKELVTENNPLDSFRAVERWHGVAAVEAVPGKTELKTSGNGRVLVNGTTKDTKIPYLITKDEYGDARVELEFMIPKESNSGIYVTGRYEVQIYDSQGRERVGYGDMGGIYQRWDPSRGKSQEGFEGTRPMSNAAKPAGEWQKMDIIFRAPRYDDAGNQRSDAFFEKVWLNGVLVQENTTTTGPTRSSPMDGNAARGPIAIQGDHGPIAIRSFRVTPVEDCKASRIAELDAYWSEVSRSVREGDFEAYKATCHAEAVLISGQKQISYPLTTALARWKKDFSDTKEGKVRGNVEFRFSKRSGDFTTAHETGVFRYTTLSDKAPPKYDFVHLEALLVKRGDGWKILMENQVGPATESDWDAIR
jgi:hypothetical protein